MVESRGRVRKIEDGLELPILPSKNMLKNKIGGMLKGQRSNLKELPKTKAGSI